MTPTTQQELLEKLAVLWELSPDVRFGQLLANLGFLVEDQTDRSLPVGMLGQDNVRCGEQTCLLARSKRQRRLGQRCPGLHLNEGQQVRSGGYHIDLAGLGAQAPRQDGPALARQRPARHAFRINAAAIRLSHNCHSATWPANAG
jgi:hypothetical protein